MTIILFLGFYNCELTDDRQEYAEMLIEKVENFKKENTRLPKGLSELGLIDKMNGPAFYQLETDSTYIIYFGLSLGESKIYESTTKKWR